MNQRDQIQPASSKKTDALPDLLREVAWIVAALLILSALYCAAARLLFHLPYPWDWPLFYRDREFTDFTIYQEKFRFFHQAGFYTVGYPFTYPAPLAMLYELFFLLPGNGALDTFLAVSTLSFTLAAALFARALQRRGVHPGSAWLFAAVLLFTSWPAALLFDRANVEVFVWIGLALAVWALVTGKEWLAAALFGIAASLKLFPFVFLALFLTRRRLPKLLFGLGVFAVVTLVSLWILGPSIPLAYHGISSGLAMFHDDYMLLYSRDLTGLDHSLMGLAKTVIVAVKQRTYQGAIASVGRVYMPAMALLGTVLYFWRIRKLPWLNQIIALSVASILLTPFSGDGTLIHLYYGFALCCFVAVSAWRERVRVTGLRTILLCYAWLFAFESFEIASGRRLEAQGKCLALIVLFVWVLRYPLGPPLGPESSPEEMRYPDAVHIHEVVPAVGSGNLAQRTVS